MMGSLIRAGLWFVVEVGGATLVKVILWLMGCSVAAVPEVDLGLEASWKSATETNT